MASCTHVDQIASEDWSWCYEDEVALLIGGIQGATRIPPSPLL